MSLNEHCVNELRNVFGLMPLPPKSTEQKINNNVFRQNKGAEIEHARGNFAGRYNDFMLQCRQNTGQLPLYLTARILPAFFKAAAENEGFAGTATTRFRQLIDEFLLDYKHNYRIGILADIVTAVFEKIFFLQVPHVAPSIEFGMGEGFASNFIFKNNKITVGSEPVLSSLGQAHSFKIHDHLMAIDMAAIPFAGASFQTVYAVHSIDHLDERQPALREMARILSPGGYLALSDVGDHYSEGLPMPDFFNLFGFEELARGYRNWLVEWGGANHQSVTAEWYRTTLADLDFEEIRVEPFMSLPLARICNFNFDMRTIFQADPWNILKEDKYSGDYAFFREFIHSVVTPLLEQDREIITRQNKWTNMFISARKKGARPEQQHHSINDNLVCPRCKGDLTGDEQHAHDGHTCYSCPSCALRFPVLSVNTGHGTIQIPLLMEMYAHAYEDILREKKSRR